jgi:hypothetical protein
MHAVEQQIYASLAIEGLKAGHHTHAATPGLSSRAIERHEEICNRWGSYEPGADFNRALVHVPLWLDEAPPAEPSHHVVVLITYQGRDGSGRPGAVLRHIVRMSAGQYRSLDFNPFHLLRSNRLFEAWQPDTPFPALNEYVDPTTADDLSGIFPERYPLLRAMLEQLLAHGKLHLPAPADSPAAEETLAQVFELVPLSVRRSLSLATFASKRADDYRLAVTRQEEASLRASLHDVQEMPPPALSPEAAAYVDRLFSALKSKDFEAALSEIRGYQPPADAPHVPAAMESIATDDEPSGTQGLSPSGRQQATPPPEMPYQRHWSQERQRDRRPLLLAVAAVAVLAVVIVWWVSRGGSSSSSPTSRTSSELARIEASRLADFIGQHETVLGQMMVANVRDFDVREEMAAASRTWDERARRALEGEAQAVGEALGATGQESVEESEALRAAADRIEAEAREGAALARVVDQGDVEALRATSDPSTGALTIEPVTGSLSGAMEDARVYAQGLRAAADALGPYERAAAGRDETAWSSAAAAFTGALQVFPSDLEAPAPIEVRAAISTAMVDVLAAERPSAMKAWAYAMPYEIERLQEGDLEDATSRLRRAAARTTAPLPPPVEGIERFYGTLWDEVAPGLARGRVAATHLIETLTPLCAQGGSVCAVDHYAAHVARWKLEAWRQAPDPSSSAASQLLAKLGQPSLPAPKLADLATVLPLLDRMEKAPVPAPSDLVDDVQRARSRVGGRFYRDLLDDWLARNQRKTASTQEAFGQQYAKLQTTLGTLRAASGTQAADAFARLRSQLASIDAGDLARADAAGEQARTAAVRKLQAACTERADVPLRRIEVHLLSGTDYAGNKRPLARLRLRLRRVGEQAPLVLGVDAPPMLAAPGVGFDAATITVDDDLALAPDDELLLVASESSDGTVWFHRYIRPAKGRHVAEALAALDEIRVRPEIARQFVTGEGLPPHGDDGEVVARVHFEFADGWWSRIVATLPGLP